MLVPPMDRRYVGADPVVSEDVPEAVMLGFSHRVAGLPHALSLAMVSSDQLPLPLSLWLPTVRTFHPLAGETTSRPVFPAATMYES